MVLVIRDKIEIGNFIFGSFWKGCKLFMGLMNNFYEIFFFMVFFII